MLVGAGLAQLDDIERTGVERKREPGLEKSRVMNFPLVARRIVQSIDHEIPVVSHSEQRAIVVISPAPQATGIPNQADPDVP